MPIEPDRFGRDRSVNIHNGHFRAASNSPVQQGELSVRLELSQMDIPGHDITATPRRLLCAIGRRTPNAAQPGAPTTPHGRATGMIHSGWRSSTGNGTGQPRVRHGETPDRVIRNATDDGW